MDLTGDDEPMTVEALAKAYEEMEPACEANLREQLLLLDEPVGLVTSDNTDPSQLTPPSAEKAQSTEEASSVEKASSAEKFSCAENAEFAEQMRKDFEEYEGSSALLTEHQLSARSLQRSFSNSSSSSDEDVDEEKEAYESGVAKQQVTSYTQAAKSVNKFFGTLRKRDETGLAVTDLPKG